MTATSKFLIAAAAAVALAAAALVTANERPPAAGMVAARPRLSGGPRPATITAISFISSITPPPATAVLQPVYPVRGLDAAGLDQCLWRSPLNGLPAPEPFWPVFPAHDVAVVCPHDKAAAAPDRRVVRLAGGAVVPAVCQGAAGIASADETLFLAGDAGDGCYRVDDGLLKASICRRRQ